MNIGMMWFDNDSKATLEIKVGRAAQYYTHKYNKRPNLCFLHPSMMPPGEPGVEISFDGVVVRSTRAVTPNYLWIGVETTKTAS